MYIKLFRQSVMLMQNLGYFDFSCECDTFTWIRIILESQIRIRIRNNVMRIRNTVYNIVQYIETYL